jgi:PhzF family phenazine biosynthesis protein
MEAWIVDAFADEQYLGNPAAVIAQLAAFPETAQMQSIARGLALPTTAFLVRQDENRYAVRWFTPGAELRICGHATIASAAYLYEVQGLRAPGLICFQTVSGPLYARRVGSDIALDLPCMDYLPCAIDGDLERALGATTVYCAKAVDDLLIEVESEEIVAALRPDFAVLAKYPYRGHIVTAKADRSQVDFVSRSFFPAIGVDEDQVCVSAHCKLGPYWSSRLHKARLTAVQLSQRGGRLTLDVADDRLVVHSSVRVRGHVPVP